MGEALNNDQIAERLHLSKRTVQQRLDNIYNKVGIDPGSERRAILTEWVWRQG